MAIFENREKVRIDATTIGGEGFYTRELITPDEAVGPVVERYAVITLEPHAKMGFHKHEGNFEIYHILKGIGEYNDNGTVVPCKPGDSFKCADGESHAIANTGDEALEFAALIIKTV